MVASVAKAQHLGRDLDTLRVNYAWLHYGRSIYVVGVYMCIRVTHRDVEEFMSPKILLHLYL